MDPSPPKKDEGYRVQMDAEIWVVFLLFTKWGVPPRGSPSQNRVLRLPAGWRFRIPANLSQSHAVPEKGPYCPTRP